MRPLNLLLSTCLTLCFSHLTLGTSDPLDNCKAYASHSISHSYQIPAITTSSNSTLQVSTSQRWTIINALLSNPKSNPSSTSSDYRTYSGGPQTALTRGIFLDTSNTIPPLGNSSDYSSLPAIGCAFILNLEYDGFSYETHSQGSNGSCTNRFTSPCLNDLKDTLQKQALQLANFTVTEKLDTICNRLAGTLRDTNLPESCNTGSGVSFGDGYPNTNGNPSFNISTTCKHPTPLTSSPQFPLFGVDSSLSIEFLLSPNSRLSHHTTSLLPQYVPRKRHG